MSREAPSGSVAMARRTEAIARTKRRDLATIALVNSTPDTRTHAHTRSDEKQRVFAGVTPLIFVRRFSLTRRTTRAKISPLDRTSKRPVFREFK